MNSSLLLLLLFPFQSFADRPEPGDRPEKFDHAPRCQQAKMNECIAQNRIVADQLQAQGMSFEPRLRAFEMQSSSLKEGLARHEQKRNTLSIEISALNAEIDFANRGAEKNSLSPMPNFPPLEDFFSLRTLHKSWTDRYPEERKQKLTARLSEAKGEKNEIDVRMEKITGDIQRLTSEYQSVVQTQSDLLTGARQHDGMCNGGCLEHFCP